MNVFIVKVIKYKFIQLLNGSEYKKIIIAMLQLQ